MKPLASILLVLCLLALAGVTSAYLFFDKPVQAEPHEGQGSATAWQREVSQELHEMKLELAGLRRALEQRGVEVGGAESQSDGQGKPEDEWSTRMRATETRLLFEAIARQREYTRTGLDQEQASAKDPEAELEARHASEEAVTKLRRALQALEAVRTSEQLSKWRADYSIEPPN